MKRIIAVSILVALLLTAFYFSVSALNENILTIDINNSSLWNPEGDVYYQGSEITIPIDILENSGTSLLVVTLEYDASVFTLINVENGEIFEDMDQGINLMWSSDCESLKTGRLATLTFKISDDAPINVYGITLNVRECYDSYGEHVVTSTHWAKNIYVDKTPGASFTGLLGDVNLDGDIDSQDLTALARHIAKIEYISDQALVNADISKDGSVSSDDLTKLARHIAKIEFIVQ